MRNNPGGVIHSISEIKGLMALTAMPAYSAAKAGMIRTISVMKFQLL